MREVCDIIVPGVQRMMAPVGSETSFERGRQQRERLAGVKVTPKASEGQAETIGAEIAAQEQEEIRGGPAIGVAASAQAGDSRAL